MKEVSDVVGTMADNPTADYRITGTNQDTVEVFVGNWTLAKRTFTNWNELDATCEQLAMLKVSRIQRPRWHVDAPLINLNNGEEL